jgi:hypothetical protein
MPRCNCHQRTFTGGAAIGLELKPVDLAGFLRRHGCTGLRSSRCLVLLW